MSIETSYGFRSAQAAYENANPFDSDCTCEGEGYICEECGEVSDVKADCQEAEGEDGIFEMRPMTDEEIAEHFPAKNCPQHGWCGGCSSRWCEDCNG